MNNPIVFSRPARPDGHQFFAKAMSDAAKRALLEIRSAASAHGIFNVEHYQHLASDQISDAMLEDAQQLQAIIDALGQAQRLAEAFRAAAEEASA